MDNFWLSVAERIDRHRVNGLCFAISKELLDQTGEWTSYVTPQHMRLYEVFGDDWSSSTEEFGYSGESYDHRVFAALLLHEMEINP